MANGNITGIELFRVGTWKGSRTVEATSAMIDQIVQNFKDVNSIPGYGVPLKLGHNSRVGEPAYGWITEVYRMGDTVVGNASDVPAEIVDAIGKRRYNSVSIELYPAVTYDGATFENVLGGVALLGAEWPAVKGLQPLSAAQFAEAGDKLELTQEIETVANEAAKFTQNDADALVLAAVTNVRTEMQALVNAEAAKATAATARAETAEAALKVFKADTQLAEFTSVIEDAIKLGRVLPKQRDQLLAFAKTFSATGTIKVGDKDVSPVAAFKEFITGLPVKVAFGERGASKHEAPGSEGKASDILHDKVTEKRQENPKLSYEQAMQSVFAEDPALKTRYAQEM